MSAEPVNPRYANLTGADVAAAHAVLEAWLEDPRPAALLAGDRGALVGIIAVAVADARWAGYTEGKAAGRAALRRDVLEALGECPHG